MDYSQVYFAVVSSATLMLAGLFLLGMLYIIAILSDIKKLSGLAKKEAEIIAKGFEKGASIFGSELSSEAAGFVKTVFALLLSHFATKKSTTKKAKKITEV